ncbi:hypothetical protein A2U01_0071369, partial [Trifolium medium]|nr:hypothetical protein [Trifolium medium]
AMLLDSSYGDSDKNSLAMVPVKNFIVEQENF